LSKQKQQQQQSKIGLAAIEQDSGAHNQLGRENGCGKIRGTYWI